MPQQVDPGLNLAVQLDAYFARIDYQGPRKPTLAALRGIHRAHAFAVTYENLDIHLGHRLTTDRKAAYRKIVIGRRGGWCYEMNGVLGWALETLGFSVRYLSGAVGREARGADAEGNHLVLLVECEGERYLADVGFGDGILEPLPLRSGVYHQDFLRFELEARADRWVFRNHPDSSATSFDFTLEPRALADFEARCYHLQTAPTSGFVRTTVCQRHVPGEVRTLRGALLTRVSATGVTEQTVASLPEYRRVLRDDFDLDLPEVAALWGPVWERHAAWLSERTRSSR